MCYTHQQMDMSEKGEPERTESRFLQAVLLIFNETWTFFFFPTNQADSRKGDQLLFFSTAGSAFEVLPEYLSSKYLLPTCSGLQRATTYYFGRCNCMTVNPACCVAICVGRHYIMLPENVSTVLRKKLALMNQVLLGQIVQIQPLRICLLHRFDSNEQRTQPEDVQMYCRAAFECHHLS